MIIAMIRFDGFLKKHQGDLNLTIAAPLDRNAGNKAKRSAFNGSLQPIKRNCLCSFIDMYIYVIAFIIN